MTTNQQRLTPIPLMEIASGLWMSKTLAVAVELGVFAHLSRSPASDSAAVGQALSIPQRPAELLLTACASLGLLEKTGELYSNAPIAEEFLVEGKPHYFGHWIALLDQHDYPGWMRLSEAVHEDHPTVFDPKEQGSLFGSSSEGLERFFDGMTSLSSFTASEICLTVDLGSRSALLDVGGGGGAYAIELCRRYPQLAVGIYDLPHVCELTMPRIQSAGLTERISLLPGDFFEDDALPYGYDTIMLSSILHDWPAEKCRTIVQKCAEALPPNGLLIISELMLDDSGKGPPSAALMGLAMLVETWGRSWTSQDIAGWATAAGLTGVNVVPVTAPGANAVLTAVKE